MALIERSQGFNVASCLAFRATSEPGRSFLLTELGPLSYAEVDGRSDALAAALANLGVERGDRVALVLPSCAEFVVSLFAVAKLGAVVVPFNPRLPPAELQYMLRHSGAVCAITIERAYGIDYLQVFEDLLVRLPELHYLVTVGEEDLWYDDRIFQYEDLISAGVGRDYPAQVIDAGDLFAILYTSGTTGKPKGVELSHRNLVSVAAGTADALGLVPDDRVVGVNALFHVFGLGPGLLSTLLAGASFVVADEPDAGQTLDLIHAHGATVHYGVPTHFVAELIEQKASPRDVSTLRIAMPAGAPVSDDLIRRISTELVPMVLVGYSMTEASSTVCVSSPWDPEDKRVQSVGRPMPGTEVRILERDGEPLPVESVGEIALKGPGVMLGYHRQPGETAAAFDPQGYLLTGDLGMVDEEGYLHLVGRWKEVIIRAGFNVYPREVESRLEAHPAVREAALVGIPDLLLGEASCACIVPVEGAIVTNQEILDWCRATLADGKVPDQVRFFDAFPRTGTGKTRRVEISRLLQSEARPA
ncbi:MAG TPA: AMP-binding protein [Longimicrobiales bacterium]|nr:AMP-binding protein [Longimicrobiales bacterium]